MLAVHYLNPTLRRFDDSVLGWLARELPTTTTLRLATGYFDSSVLDWLEEPIEQLLARAGNLHCIIGSNGGQTGAADLARLLRLVESGDDSSLYVEYAEGGIFHPKVFLVEQQSRVKALVGSANLTTNGSIVNIEAGLIVETDTIGPPAEPPLQAIIESIDGVRREDALRVRTDSDLAHLTRLGIIDRVVKRQTVNATPQQAAAQRQRRQRAGIRTRPVVSGIPHRTRRPAVPGRLPTGPLVPRSRPVASATAPSPATAGGPFYGVQFSSNDLKDTGTREFSVSRSIRAWASSILGREIAPGDGTLLEFLIEGRLAASPGSVFQTPRPTRLWAAGGSGSSHQDVRLGLGARLKAALDDEAVLVTGFPMPAGSIGVFELPVNPTRTPVRLTVFLPGDPAYSVLAALLGKSGREQKLHFQTGVLPQVPSWP